SAADNDWLSVCWSPELSLFVAVANSGTGNRVMTSSNGITWSVRASAVDNGWFGVCWSPELSVFVAVSSAGNTTGIMTSNVGIPNSKSAVIANPSYFSVNNTTGAVNLTHNIGTLGYMYSKLTSTSTLTATTLDVLNNRVRTSRANAIACVSTWTLRAAPNTNIWYSICWSPERGIFVAVSASGTGNRVMTSPDGINWTARTSAADNQWTAVTYGNGLFVAVARTGTGNRVMTSPDGINWTIRTSAADNDWYDVSY